MITEINSDVKLVNDGKAIEVISREGVTFGVELFRLNGDKKMNNVKPGFVSIYAMVYMSTAYLDKTYLHPNNRTDSYTLTTMIVKDNDEKMNTLSLEWSSCVCNTLMQCIKRWPSIIGFVDSKITISKESMILAFKSLLSYVMERTSSKLPEPKYKNNAHDIMIDHGEILFWDHKPNDTSRTGLCLQVKRGDTGHSLQMMAYDEGNNCTLISAGKYNEDIPGKVFECLSSYDTLKLCNFLHSCHGDLVRHLNNIGYKMPKCGMTHIDMDQYVDGILTSMIINLMQWTA